MSESLRNALEASEKPILSRQLLATGEDFVVTFLNSTRVVDSGFMLFKLDTEICQSSLSKKEDIRKTKKTEFAQHIKTAKLAPGLLGCQRESLPRTLVGKVLGHSDFSIGDVSLSNLVTRKLVDFFSLINTHSIFSSEELGQEVGGFTHSTIQLNGGPCKLPFHIEHWGGVSVNVLHWGPAKVWYIIHPKLFVPAILSMQRLQENVDLGKFWGVCDDTTSHRDMFYDVAHLSVECQRVVQMPGEGVFLAPFALHAVENLGENCAASINYMPPHLLHQCAAYKTCSHSEGNSGKPLFTTMTAKIEDLFNSGKIGIDAFIHSSDPLKSYKLRVVEKQMKDGNTKKLKEVIDHIKQKATTPTWFESILPMERNQILSGLEPVRRSHSEKDFSCPACLYSTNNSWDLRKHILRKHAQVPPNIPRVECPDCGKSLKDLRKHKGSKICKKGQREV